MPQHHIPGWTDIGRPIIVISKKQDDVLRHLIIYMFATKSCSYSKIIMDQLITGIEVISRLDVAHLV